MKRIVTIIGCILFSELVFSQSFISETKLWSNYVHGTEYGSPYESFYIMMTIDSVSLGSTYGKVYRDNDSLQSNWFVDGYIRETDTGTIFYRGKDELAESLLYNFGVREKDSILALVIDEYNFYLYVDSIKIKPFGIYNEHRKHIYLSRNRKINCDVWVEGVGSKIGGVLMDLPSYFLTGEGRGLLCFSENDSLKYKSMNTCFLTGYYMINEVNETSDQFNVINSAGELIISQNGTQIVDFLIKIYDMNGRQLFTKEISERDIFSMNSSQLSNGMYIFLIQGGKFFKSGKFMIY